MDTTIGQIRGEANMTEKRGDSFPGGITKSSIFTMEIKFYYSRR